MKRIIIYSLILLSFITYAYAGWFLNPTTEELDYYQSGDMWTDGGDELYPTDGEDLAVKGSGPDITLQVTGGDTFGWHAETDLSYWKNNTDNNIYWLADSNHNLMLVPDAGNVGIGKGLGSASYKLDVNGDIRTITTLRTDGNIVLPTTTPTTGIYYAGANRFIHNFGTNNLFLGIDAGNLTLSGAIQNVGIGANALDALTSGDHNFALGANAGGATNTGEYNVAIGSDSFLANQSGSFNIAIGSFALNNQTAASNNIAIGYSAGLNWSTGNQVAIGYKAGRNATGNSCIFLGYEAGYNETGNNKLYIENSNSATPLIYGEFDNNLLRIYGTLDVLDASNPQLRLTHTDETVYTDFQTDSGGDLTIDASGGDVLFPDQVGIGTVTVPVVGLHMQGANLNDAQFRIVSTIPSSVGAGGGFVIYSDDGAATGVNDRLGYTLYGGADTSAHTYSNSAGIVAYADQNFVYLTQAGTRMVFETITNGSISRTGKLFIAGIGYIGILTAGPDRALDVLDDTDPQLRLTHTDGSVYTDFQTDGNGDLTITASGDEILVADVVRGTTSLWYNEYHLGASQTSPGVSGASEVELNGIFSWNLDAITEYLYYGADIHDDWDAATDVEIEVTGYLGEAETADDLIRMSILCNYGTDHDNANTFKTQTLTADHDIDALNAQYSVHTIPFTFNFDEDGNVLEILDTLHLRVYLDDVTSAPVVTDFNVTFVTIKYKSAQVRIEVD